MNLIEGDPDECPVEKLFMRLFYFSIPESDADAKIVFRARSRLALI
jgi:hypothetical protein